MCLAPAGAWEMGRIAVHDRAQEPFRIEGSCGRWMLRFRLRRNVGFAPLDFLLEPRFPIICAGIIAHFTQDDDLPPHVIDLGIGKKDTHFRLLLARHARHVTLKPSTELQSALKASAGRRFWQTMQMRSPVCFHPCGVSTTSPRAARLRSA